MAKQVDPKRFRLRGIAVDGLQVTLGRYETEREANTDRDRLEKDGVYRELCVEKLDVPDPPPEDERSGSAGRSRS